MTIDNYLKKSDREREKEITKEFMAANQTRKDIYLTPCLMIYSNMDYQHALKNIRDYLYFDNAKKI